MTRGNLNTIFYIGTAYCLLPMMMHLASQASEVTPTVSNATPEALLARVGPQGPQPSLVTQKGGELTLRVWLNGKFHTKPWTQAVPEATQSPPDLTGDKVSDPGSASSGSESEGT